MRFFLGLLLLVSGQLVSPVYAANGTCISSPQSACTSLVAICVSKVATGQVASNNFWSAPECFTAATCAGSAAVLDAACCAGTCVALANMNSLDYNNVYAPMVGSCAFAPNGCPVTWTDFVNYFYNTIQATNTNNWPLSGDDVLGWWSEIATWTAVCSGTSCVNGQIPYLNFDDWLRFSSSTLITTPGNPPIRDPLSSDRDNNTNIWDPTADAPCPFTDQTLCFEDNGPQEPPEVTNTVLSTSTTPLLPRVKLATLSLVPTGARTSFATGTKFLPPNIPPPVYITNGTQKVLVDLNLSGGEPPARRQYSLVEKHVPSYNVSLEKRPVVRSDVCKGAIDTPSPLPILTYYCDYMPHICASIRGSGFLTNDQIVLTYDPFGTGTRRNSVCTKEVNNAFRTTGGCDRRQHDPLYWLISCDEFPMNSVLEGGRDNGAIVTAVPEREQQYQGSLHTAVSKLLRVENDARSQWSKPRNVKNTYAGQCHKFILSLVDARPAGTSSIAIGSLFTGGAFMYDQAAQHTEILVDSRAGPPPAPRLTPYDYPADAIALKPTGSYRSFDCRPCTIGSVTTNPAAQAALDAFNNVTRVTDLQVEAAAAASCTKTMRPTSTPTPTSDASTNAAEAAAAAAAAKAALNSANESAATMAAAQAVVKAAEAAVSAAAIAAAAAIANSPAAMASALASAVQAQTVLQSTISALTDIFGTGTIPDAIATIISQASIIATDTSSVLTDTWNTKPPQSDPVPPDSDPVHSPTTNSGGGASVPPAACFGPGSTGQLTINGPYIWLSTGTATEPGTITDAGNAAYFGVTMASDGPYILSSLCSGVYAWTSGAAQPSYQVSCSSKEFGSYWNAVKQQCYVFPFSSTTYGVVCANDVGNIYSCLQSQGYQSQITAVSFSWSS